MHKVENQELEYVADMADDYYDGQYYKLWIVLCAVF